MRAGIGSSNGCGRRVDDGRLVSWETFSVTIFPVRAVEDEPGSAATADPEHRADRQGDEGQDCPVGEGRLGFRCLIVHFYLQGKRFVTE